MNRRITDLLKEAITDIENLQEYYNLQKEYVYKYVKNNIKKYKYGVLLNRFCIDVGFLQQRMHKE